MNLPDIPSEPVDFTLQADETREDWLGRIAIRYYRLLYSTAFRIMRNEQDAEDVVQQSILKALKNADQLDTSKAVVAWLVRITRNTALDLIRKQKRRANVTDMQEMVIQAAEDPAELYRVEDDIRELLLEAIEKLPYKIGQTLLLRHFNQMEVEDIAIYQKTSKNNVRVRLSRGYSQLRSDSKVCKALNLTPDKTDF